MKNNFTKIMNENLENLEIIINEENDVSYADYYNKMYGYKKDSKSEMEKRDKELEYEKKKYELLAQQARDEFEKERKLRDMDWREYQFNSNNQYKREQLRTNDDWRRDQLDTLDQWRRDQLKTNDDTRRYQIRTNDETRRYQISSNDEWRRYQHDSIKGADKVKYLNEIYKYNADFIELVSNFEDKVEKIPSSLLPSEKDEEFKKIKKAYNEKLKRLNNKLNYTIKSEMKKYGIKPYLDITEEIRDFDAIFLKEEQFFNMELSSLEEKMIFGDVLSALEDLSILEAADPTKVQKDAISSYNKVLASKNATPYEKNQAKMNQNMVIANTQKKIADQSNALAANQDPVSGERLKEATDPNGIIAAKQEVLDDKKAAIEKKEETFNRTLNNQKEAVEKMQDNINAIKEKQKTVSSDQKVNPVSSETVTNESVDPNKLEKTKINYNDFSATFFKGDKGALLRFAVEGKSKSDSLTKNEELYINYMKNDPDVQIIVKKLAYYYRKASSGLSYEETVQVKILKNKFEEALKEAKIKSSKRFE